VVVVVGGGLVVVVVGGGLVVVVVGGGLVVVVVGGSLVVVLVGGGLVVVLVAAHPAPRRAVVLQNSLTIKSFWRGDSLLARSNSFLAAASLPIWAYA
jgi:hypothetical protein